jgi:hypothetical protein
MLISLATMDFRLCHLLQKKLTKGGFVVEHIAPGEKPSKGSILAVVTEKEEETHPTPFDKKVILNQKELLDINLAYSKIILGIEGKQIWESLIVGVDPGLTIGVAIITDSFLRSTLETREISEAIAFVLAAIRNNPAKMAIIRVGSTGGYRRVLILNKLLNVKPTNVSLEIVDELKTTPLSYNDAKSDIENGMGRGAQVQLGKNATAAMEIAFRLGERVSCPEDWEISKGEIKEIQILSRQYSKGKVTISKELAQKVGCGLLTMTEAINIQKRKKKN